MLIVFSILYIHYSNNTLHYIVYVCLFIYGALIGVYWNKKQSMLSNKVP